MALNRLRTRAWKLNSAVALLIPRLVKRLNLRLCCVWGGRTGFRQCGHRGRARRWRPGGGALARSGGLVHHLEVFGALAGTLSGMRPTSLTSTSTM
jgi:hypothetical protein